jgi:hypothetical protein
MFKKFSFQGSVAAFVLSIAAYVISLLGYIDESIMLVLVGLFGFSGLAALRTYIEEKGWKTYAVVAGGALGIIGLLFNVASPDQIGVWFTFLGLTGAATTGHAIKKAKR